MLARALLAACLFLGAQITAQENPAGERYVADIELQTSEQFVQLLQRAGELLVEGVATQDDGPTVTFVLHGPVIRDLLRQNYGGNTELVNLAASLTALEVVQIKACRTWMGIHNIEEADLQPFVAPVNLWKSEVDRLYREENYLDF